MFVYLSFVIIIAYFYIILMWKMNTLFFNAESEVPLFPLASGLSFVEKIPQNTKKKINSWEFLGDWQENLSFMEKENKGNIFQCMA